MTTPSLADLRYLFFGGGSAAEYDFLQQMQAQGLTASFLAGTKVLGSAQDVALRQQVGAGTSDVPNTTLTIQPYPRPWMFLWTGYQYNNTALSSCDLLLALQDNTVVANGIWASAVNNQVNITTHMKLMAAITVATTYKLRLNSNGNTANVLGTAATPTQLVAVGL